MATGVEDLGTMVLAAGALGTAAMGVVDGLKRWEWVDVAGYQEALSYVSVFLPAVREAYGDRADDVLKAQYRDGRGAGELPKTLRQGLRIGLVALAGSEDQLRSMASAVGVVAPAELVEVAQALHDTGDLNDGQRKVLAQFELAAHARIDAGMAIAEKIYVTWQKQIAAVIAIVIALVVGLILLADNQATGWVVLKALVVGIAAVPFAPIAKDLSTALSEAAKALKRP
jgi:hypothetical protein